MENSAGNQTARTSQEAPTATPAAPPLHVVIVGAGIAGLGAALQLRRAIDAGHNITYTVYESDGRIGGQLWTDRPTLPCGGAAIADGGSDSYLTRKAASMFRVADYMGTADQLIGTDESTKQTFIVKCGKLVPLPDGIMMFAPTKILPMATTKLYSWPAKFRMALDIVKPRRKRAPGEDESIGSLVRRRLGTECFDRLAEPLVGGINGSDPDTMSTLGTYPMLLDMEDKYGSLILGFLAQRKSIEEMKKKFPPRPGRPTTFFSSSKRGLDDYTNSMAEKAGVENICTSTPITAIERSNDGRYKVTIRDESNTDIIRHFGIRYDDAGNRIEDVANVAKEKTVQADAVIIAAPAWVAGDLIENIAPEASEILSDIPHSSCATIITAWNEDDAPFEKNWHGILAPGIEKQPVTGISLMSSKWAGRAPNGTILIRGFVGGARDDNTHNLPDDELIELCRKTYVDLLGLKAGAQPTYAKVFRFPRCMPQYIVGHPDRMDTLDNYMSKQPGLSVGGAAYTGVGVPNCMESGESAAMKILRDLEITYSDPEEKPRGPGGPK